MSFAIPHNQRMLRAVSTRSALEDGRMNLLTSICCLVGSRCAPQEGNRPQTPCGLVLPRIRKRIRRRHLREYQPSLTAK